MSALLFDLMHGLSGDMILGALFDLGLDPNRFAQELALLDLPQASVEVTSVLRHGLRGLQAQVPAEKNPPERHYTDLDARIAQSRLQAVTKSRARAILRRLGEVEAELHGVTLDRVHFHELGALDTLVDIVGACIGFELLGITEFWTTPFPIGEGTLSMAHGKVTEPAPATWALLQGFTTRRTGLTHEHCTPTGTAIVTTLAKPLPKNFMAKSLRTGYGAGSRDLAGVPNVVRLCLLAEVALESQGLAPAGARGAPAPESIEMSCNLDNMTAEHLGYVTERLLNLGCQDVWQEPIVMKKGRLATKLCLLVNPSQLENVVQFMAQETLSGGFRMHTVQRLVAHKAEATGQTQLGEIELKKVHFKGLEITRTLPEYESVRATALAQKVPWFTVWRAALEASVTSELTPEKRENT